MPRVSKRGPLPRTDRYNWVLWATVASLTRAIGSHRETKFLYIGRELKPPDEAALKLVTLAYRSRLKRFPRLTSSGFGTPFALSSTRTLSEVYELMRDVGLIHGEFDEGTGM